MKKELSEQKTTTSSLHSNNFTVTKKETGRKLHYLQCGILYQKKKVFFPCTLTHIHITHTLQCSSGDKSRRDFHSNRFSYFYLLFFAWDIWPAQNNMPWSTQHSTFVNLSRREISIQEHCKRAKKIYALSYIVSTTISFSSPSISVFIYVPHRLFNTHTGFIHDNGLLLCVV